MIALPMERTLTATAMIAAAAVWPSVLCFAAEHAASPFERALRTAWCGAAPQASEVLGHCVACWSGAGALGLAGVLILAAPQMALARPRARR